MQWLSPAKIYVGSVLLAAIIYVTIMISFMFWGDKIPLSRQAVLVMPLVFLLACMAALYRFIKNSEWE